MTQPVTIKDQTEFHTRICARPAGQATRLHFGRLLLVLSCVLSCVLLTVPSIGGSAAILAQDVTEQEETAIKAAVKHASRSIVRIETFGGLERVGKVLIGTGPTTGLIVSSDGYIISSAFNFIQMPSSILIVLPDGKRKPARILARDLSRKLVMLKIEPDSEQELTVPEAVARDDMRVGQWAIAVGRTLSADSTNVSVGILSARNRIWGKAIQTDAKISPSNYGGPLLDIQGRVMGVLVPLSPQQQGEVAGAEWYDSGIGFAIPLDDILARIESLKQGKDLMPGLLGIRLKGKDIYDGAPVIASVRINSPAYDSGLKADDEIVEVAGKSVRRQAQLKHALGALYAGDPVKIVVKRENDRLEFEPILAEKLLPYFHPFLGILPMRPADGQESEDAKGVAVRYVFPGSPAAELGLIAGDRLVELGEKPLSRFTDLDEAVIRFQPESETTVKFVRASDDEIIEKSVMLKRVTVDTPASLPPAHPPTDGPVPDSPAKGTVKIEIPEHAQNQCVAFVPDTYRPEVGHGLVVCLHGADRLNQQAWIERWKDHCEKHDLILVAPQSTQERRWTPTDSEYIGKVVNDVISHYNIDRSRIVAHGLQTGGVMAFIVAFDHRDLFRAVVAVDASFPARIREPENDPVNRLAVLFHLPGDSKLTARVTKDSKRLSDLGFPTTRIESGGRLKPPNREELSDTARWIDMLDRI